jgi:hypothetical protein
MSDEIKPYVLSGTDFDELLTKTDMSEKQWDILMSCHHQGACDDDAKAASEYFILDNEQGYVDACKRLIDAGIERERFLHHKSMPVEYENIKDDQAVIEYYLWILAGNLQDRGNDD